MYGAGETCHGLGVRFDFDPARIAVDPSKPLLQGGLASTNTWLDDEIEGLVRRIAQQLNVDASTPFEQLPQKVAGRLLSWRQGAGNPRNGNHRVSKQSK